MDAKQRAHEKRRVGQHSGDWTESRIRRSNAWIVRYAYAFRPELHGYIREGIQAAWQEALDEDRSINAYWLRDRGVSRATDALRKDNKQTWGQRPLTKASGAGLKVNSGKCDGFPECAKLSKCGDGDYVETGEIQWSDLMQGLTSQERSACGHIVGNYSNGRYGASNLAEDMGIGRREASRLWLSIKEKLSREESQK